MGEGKMTHKVTEDSVPIDLGRASKDPAVGDVVLNHERRVGEEAAGEAPEQVEAQEDVSGARSVGGGALARGGARGRGRGGGDDRATGGRGRSICLLGGFGDGALTVGGRN